MYMTRFTVRGKGSFPFDMLRYDACHPAGPGDVSALSPFMNDEVPRAKQTSRDVTLCTYHRTKQETHTACTVQRWNSFGWAVLTIEEPRKLD